ncbi:MAG: LamG-like jellyroll fold domain-containing protein [Candidatus Methanoperedens sp.]|nr:LamG-like jellyroll fold domain-containing protein [Candidatus Methanoperedens sp.]
MSRFSSVIGILITLALLMPVQAQEEGLVAEWHFDEGAGNVVKDSSGNGNDGTIYGATWVDGKFDKGMVFNGKDDYVFSSSFQNYPTISVEAWIRINTYGESQIVSKWNDFNANQRGWLLYQANNQIIFYISRDGTEYLSVVDPVIASLNSWYHYVGTYDGKNIKLYRNGVIVSETQAIGNNVFSNSANLLFGIGKESTNYRAFNGLIDEVRIYNRALNAEEVKASYEGEQTALSITKSALPTSIKQGQSTTITLTVKNSGSTEITDIEIADVIPKDLTLLDGETKKTYASLSPKDSRQFQYSVQINEAGTFNLGQATASYADNKGNYQTIKSKPASIEVIPSLVTDSKQTPSRKSNNNVQSASVNLHGEKTDVALGENVLLKLSAVNIIGNPTMHVQVIIIPPSGWSVTSSEFAKSGAGQYTTTYDLDSGGGKDIEVRIVPNQVGEDFQVEGRIIYYFGDDVATREDHTLNLPIKVRAKSNIEMTTVAPQSDKQSTPGFAFVVGVLGLLVAMQFIKRK